MTDAAGIAKGLSSEERRCLGRRELELTAWLRAARSLREKGLLEDSTKPLFSIGSNLTDLGRAVASLLEQTND